jgi:hypothetical protein
MGGGTIRVLLAMGVVGPPLFVAIALVQGVTRPAYDPVRMPISLLALGDLGWMQVANFLVFGSLTFGFAVGLRRATDGQPDCSRWGPPLIAAFALGIVAAGLFRTDPGGGYPPGVSTGSGTGTLHDLATLTLFVALTAAGATFGLAFRRADRNVWARYSAVSAVLLAVGFGLTIVAYNGEGELSRVGGVVQRLTILVGWTWLTILAVDQGRRFARRAATRSA